MSWLNYTIRNNESGECCDFYAPDLETAFGLARARWPLTKSWSYLGGCKR